MICIEENLPLVHACAHRMEGRGIAYEELFAAGSEGLVKAAKGFDVSRGFAFSTYAVPVILGEMKRLFRDGGAVKVGRALKTQLLSVGRAQEKLRAALGREPTVSEIAKDMDLSREEVAQALAAALPPMSLTVSDDDGELPIAVESEEEKIVCRLSVEQAIDSLPPRDRDIIKLRYFGEQTQSATAKKLNMTQVQVSRRERIILAQLRKILG